MKGRNGNIAGCRMVAALFTVLALIFWAIPSIAGAMAGQMQDLIGRLNAKYADFDKKMNNVIIKTVEHSGASETKMKIYRKNDKLRVESLPELPGVRLKNPDALGTVIIWDGSSAWMITATGQKKIPGVTKDTFQAENNWWKEIARGAKISGEETVGGRQCYVIGIARPKARFDRIWIDKNDLVMVKAATKSPGGKRLEWLFSDFKNIGGWDVPFKTETLMSGKVVSTSDIESFEFGRELPDGLFVPPGNSGQ
ncbi:MAG: hypothetical protein M0Z75_14460 [Nitrospiraceae bacterium]|nr:hypothetical protein [Nitrospiraceae bacterium]